MPRGAETHDLPKIAERLADPRTVGVWERIGQYEERV
jgi:hypothetical protein